MSGITRAIPQPVSVRIGGRDFLAREFRLEDVATIQAWIDNQIGHPFERAAPAIECGLADRSPPWRRLVAATIDALADWPKEPGTPEADALLSSEAGRKLIIVLALRRDQPDVASQIDALYDAATKADYDRLSRVAWGVDPLRKLMSLVDGEGDDEGDPPDWEALRFDYQESGHRGPAFEELTVSQFLAWRRGGKSYGGEAAGIADWEGVAERRRAFRSN